MKNYQPLDLLTMPLEGRCLIEASAGTGKTYTIVNLYLRLLLEQQLGVRSILVVTFTEAATKELRERIRSALVSAADPEVPDETIRALVRRAGKQLGPQRVRMLLRRALVGFDEAAIYTIHGFCKRMLRDNSFESGMPFDMELMTDQSDLLRQIADDFWRLRFSTGKALPVALGRKNGIGPEQLVRLAGELVRKPSARPLPVLAPVTAEELCALFAEIAAEWQARHDQITNILLHDTGLSRSQKAYKPEVVDGYVRRLSCALREEPTTENLGVLRRFAASELAAGVKPGKEPPSHRFFDLCEQFIVSEPAFAISVKLDFIEYVHTELPARKKGRNELSFDDLLSAFSNALQSAEGEVLARSVRRQFSVALIDEFQDTDPVQYGIFSRLFDRLGHSLFLIGDPKQAIYGFRGADIFSYIRAAEDTRDERRFTLQTNWRSGDAVVRAANELFGEITNPFVLGDTIDYHRVESAAGSKGNLQPLVIEGEDAAGLVCWFLKKEQPTPRSPHPNKDEARQAAAGAVVAEITRLLTLAQQGGASLGERPLRPSDIAVLVTRNEDALLFSEPLSRRGIPAVLAKSGSIFHTEEAADVERFLLAAAAPGNITALNGALSSDLIGCSATELRDYLEDPDSLSAYEKHLERFAAYSEIWAANGFMKMFRTCLADYGVRRRLLDQPYGERRLTNLLQLSELIHTAAEEEHRGPNSVLSWIAAQRDAAEERDEQELRLERDGNAVQILTVFKSKGLEYPIVFCPFMWQQGAAPQAEDIIFHRDSEPCLALGPSAAVPAYRDAAARERLAELMRLLYVAVTRAQNRCYLSCGRIGNPAATALDYLIACNSVTDTAATATELQTIFKKLSADDLYADIAKRFAGAGNAIRLIEPDKKPAPPFCHPETTSAGEQLQPKTLSASTKIDSAWDITSFSRMTKGERHTVVTLKHDEPAASNGDLPAQQPEGFFAFPRGARPGTCIHELFERLDFTREDQAYQTELVEPILGNYGLADSEGTHTAMVCDMLDKVLSAPLLSGRPDFCLTAVEGMLSELEFYYPLAPLTPEVLSGVFTRAGLPGEVPERVGKLAFKPLYGYVQGFIDLVFCFKGKYYLLDWKTNHLGNRYGDYDRPALEQAMAEAHYHVQAALYAVALHKYLQARLDDYVFDTHFGGVFYLFIRGMHPEIPGSGIYYDRPDREAIKELSTLCG
ncbi:MAG: exodeoxyribonuclease V subunit beta [Deltaproteobacteria bacterium]|nr:exodeoxyribonuclease V subunit beta [Deltaproteobacteria bacterium]